MNTSRRWLFFFFQAEDGIRDYKVTGVQTCALPISVAPERTDLLMREGKLHRSHACQGVAAGCTAGRAEQTEAIRCADGRFPDARRRRRPVHGKLLCRGEARERAPRDEGRRDSAPPHQRLRAGGRIVATTAVVHSPWLLR